jgi:type I restriction enzyme S subunit
MGQRLVQVRPAAGTLRPEYLLHVLLLALAPERISQSMVGSTAQHLNVGDLRALRVPTPPLDLQDQFVRRLAALQISERLQREQALSAEELFASLQQRAFSGTL